MSLSPFLATLAHAKPLSEEEEVDRVISAGFHEDISNIGDLSSLSTVSPSTQATGTFLVKADGVIAGLEVARKVFKYIDPSVSLSFSVSEGDKVQKGQHIGTIKGSALSLLLGERLSLNLLQRMSGVATMTNRMVVACEGTNAKVLDTRKTIPGLRVLDKWAVRSGGGVNHRYGLYDMIMIKDNHISAAGGITKAVSRAQEYLKERGLEEKVAIEVETRTLDEIREIASLSGVSRVMLDNMVTVEEGGQVNTSMLETAVALLKEEREKALKERERELENESDVEKREREREALQKEREREIETEASGNVTLATIGTIARTGVSHISSGALTHSVTALDISMKIKSSDLVA